MGDWRDAHDTSQGDVAYALTKVVDDDRRKPVRWDVTTLVREWACGKHSNLGMFLRITDGRGPIVFGSRESPDVTLHPKLELVGSAGSVSLDPLQIRISRSRLTAVRARLNSFAYPPRRIIS